MQFVGYGDVNTFGEDIARMTSILVTLTHRLVSHEFGIIQINAVHKILEAILCKGHVNNVHEREE